MCSVGIILHKHVSEAFLKSPAPRYYWDSHLQTSDHDQLFTFSNDLWEAVSPLNIISDHVYSILKSLDIPCYQPLTLLPLMGTEHDLTSSRILSKTAP